MRKLLGGFAAEVSSWRTWAKQIFWSLLMAGLLQIFLWIYGFSPATSARAFAFWLVVPLLILASMRLLRGTVDLRCNIEAVAQQQVSLEGLGKRHVLVLFVVVANRGDRPSAANGWRISLKMAGSNDEHVLEPIWLTNRDDEDGLLLSVAGAQLPVRYDDLIVQKTFKAIQPGDRESGFLCGLVPEGINAVDITGRAGNEVTAMYRDIRGRNYQAKITTSGRLGTQALTLPGLEGRIRHEVTNTEAPEQPEV